MIIIIIHNLLSAIKRNSWHVTNIKSMKNLHTKSQSKNIIDRSKTDQGCHHACQCIVMGGRKNIKPPKWQEAAEQNKAVPYTMKPLQYN